MPEYKCPVGDYTARGTTIAEAARALSEHLISQHCDPAPDDASSDASDLPSDLSSVSLEGLDASISAHGRIEVDPGVERGRRY